MTRFQDYQNKLRIVHNAVLAKKDGEFRVNFTGGKEATAYYTTDLEDAFATGVEMATSLKPRHRIPGVGNRKSAAARDTARVMLTAENKPEKVTSDSGGFSSEQQCPCANNCMYGDERWCWLFASTV